jgi:formate dehydrogenase major subunit
MVRVTIDGAEQVVPDEATILDALRLAGVSVPTLCHDDRLAPYGGCRLCVVSVKGAPRPKSACDTRVAPGMEIETRTPELEELRRTNLELLAERYPLEAVRSRPDAPFHRLLSAYGVVPRGGAAASRVDHPYLLVDMARCIDCYRCVRICDELQGQFVWRQWGRGDRTEVRVDGPSLAESPCVGCGACADTCPTGAIADRYVAGDDPTATWTRTVCPYCGVGCEMEVAERHGRIAGVRPALDAPVNKGHLCVKGRYAHEFVHAPDRVVEPMIRRGGDWEAVSWEEAVGFVASRLTEIVATHGPNSVGVLGSARSTNEEAYVAQKLARVVLGTNSVDCCARVCHAPSAIALKRMLGAGAATNSFDDVERARSILVFGANATENHPVVGARIKQAVRAGARLVVVDPRRIELAEYADIHLQLRPGTNVPLLNALACEILAAGLEDRRFISERVDGLADFAAAVGEWPAERAARICGVDARAIRDAARLYATARPAMCVHGLGAAEHVQGVESVMALANLALLTGNVGGPGCGVNPLRGQNNVQGAAQMGCDARGLTGAVPIEEGRARFERAWGTALPASRGLTVTGMVDAARAGTLKALWAIGYDLLATLPTLESTKSALSALELVVVQDLFMTETAREVGHVFLPATSSFEKDGTFMNAERRIQRVRAVIPPVGNAHSDWEIVCDVARAAGHESGFGFASAEAIWDEIREVWPDAAGITYERLEHGGIQWPCRSSDDPGTPTLHVDTFAKGARVSLRPIEYQPTPERVADDFPILLTTGRSLYQFNAATMTDRTPNHELRPTDTLDLSPEDARERGLADGDRARVVSRYGDAVIPVRVTDAVRRGECFATFHDPRVALNRVCGPHRDPFAETPEYKVTAVRIEAP